MASRPAAQLEGTTIAEVIELLAVLNARSAELAIDHATEEDVARLAAGRDAILAGVTRDEILQGVETFLRALAEAAHQPLLAVISNFLIRVLIELELEIFPESPQVWREWTDALADVRAETVEAMQDRDPERLVNAVEAYHSDAAKRLHRSGIDQRLKLSAPRFSRLMTNLINRA